MRLNKLTLLEHFRISRDEYLNCHYQSQLIMQKLTQALKILTKVIYHL